MISMRSVTELVGINKYKNPNGYMYLAIKLHNPKAGYKYHKDIEDKYNELINN